MDGNRFTKTYSNSRIKPVELLGDGLEGPPGPQGETDCTSVIKAMGEMVREDLLLHQTFVECSTFVPGDIPIFVVKSASSQGELPKVIDISTPGGFLVQFSAGDDSTYYWMLITAAFVPPP